MELVADAERAGEPGLLGRHATWERVDLGSIASVLNGFAFKSHYFNRDGEGIPIIRIRDVGRESTGTYYAGPYEDQYLIDRGDVIVGMDGDFRVATWRGPSALLNQRVCKISIRDESLYDRRFLVYVLQGYLDAIWSSTSSVTVKHLSSRSVQQIPLPLPPLAEQHRIVEALEGHLSRLDAARVDLQQSVSRLAALRGGVRNVVAHAHRPEVELPDGWAWGQLSDVLERIEAGKSFRCEPRPATEREWGVIKVSAMTWGEFRADEQKAVPVGREFDSRHEIKPGDILVSRANTPSYVGAPVLVGRCRPRLLLSDKSLRLVPGVGVDRGWLIQILSSPYVRHQISAKATGTKDSMRNISQRELSAVRIPIPPIVSQGLIAEVLDTEVQRVNSLESSLNLAQIRAKHLRQALLNRAFAGALVPQDPTDEAASALLDRIRAECEARSSSKSAKRTPRRPRKATAAADGPPPPPPSTPASAIVVQQELPL
ncbi:restriction endonuclease subunit S [Streptomyces sp. NPDC087300]|uniref:restriction endonuclease subunit S n=1 Tax=Streptomyces sp. NPDC087300 TaxID=3365780 RepID=UPI00382CC871